MEPLFDLTGRTVAVGGELPTAAVIDALLRMNADAKHWRTPITVYLGVGGEHRRGLTAIEAVQMCSLLPSLRSAVHTVGLGLLHGFEPLVLAAGHPGHRHLLPHALISIGGLEVEGVPQLPNGTVGLAHHHQGLSLREQAKAMITTQIRQLSKDFRLPRDLWTNPRVITAAQAVQVGLADALVPSINPQRIPKFEKPHEKETALAPTQP